MASATEPFAEANADPEANSAPSPADRRTQIEAARRAQPSLAAARTLEELGQIGSARKMLRQVLARDPADEAAWSALLDLIDDNAERLVTARAATQQFPDNPNFAHALYQATPAVEPSLPEPAKSPLQMVCDRAIAAGEPIGPIRVKRIEVRKRPQYFLEIWISALLGPTKSNYQEILEHNPSAPLRALLWVSLCGGFAALIQAGWLLWTFPELRELLGRLEREPLLVGGVAFVVSIWILPAAGLLLYSIAVTGASIAFGGDLDFHSQVFLTAAWQAPLSLIMALVTCVPVLNIVGGLVLGFYQLPLAITAIQAAQDVDGPHAIYTMALAGILMALPICLIAWLMPTLGLEAGQTLRQLVP